MKIAKISACLTSVIRIVLVCHFYSFHTCCQAQPAVNDATAILKQVKLKWMEYSEKLNSSEWNEREIITERFNTANSNRKHLSKRTINTFTDRKADSYMVITKYALVEGYNIDNCIGINPRYCFELKKKPIEQKWRLFKSELSSDPDVDIKKIGFQNSMQRPSKYVYDEKQIGISGFNFRVAFADLLTATNFSLVSDGTQSGTGFHVVKFDLFIPAAHKYSQQNAAPVSAVCKSTLKLDVEHHLLPVELTQTYIAHGEVCTVHTVQTYKWNNKLTLPTEIITTCTTTISVDNKQFSQNESVDHEMLSYDRIEPVQFTLTAFGFPEPEGVAPPPLPRTGYMMYLYISIPVFAALGLLAAYIRRRYYPRAVALPPAGTAGS